MFIALSCTSYNSYNSYYSYLYSYYASYYSLWTAAFLLQIQGSGAPSPQLRFIRMHQLLIL